MNSLLLAPAWALSYKYGTIRFWYSCNNSSRKSRTWKYLSCTLNVIYCNNNNRFLSVPSRYHITITNRFSWMRPVYNLNRNSSRCSRYFYRTIASRQHRLLMKINRHLFDILQMDDRGLIWNINFWTRILNWQ